MLHKKYNVEIYHREEPEISKHSWKYEILNIKKNLKNYIKIQFWWFLRYQYLFNYQTFLNITCPRQHVFFWDGEVYSFIWVSIGMYVDNGTVKVPIFAEIRARVQVSTSKIWNESYVTFWGSQNLCLAFYSIPRCNNLP